MDVGGWLRGLGLGQYEANFRDNKINADPRLTNDDLKDIGVSALGDRLQLLDAIAALARAKTPPGVPAWPSKPKGAEVSAERRPITVMFCDLVGSTSLAAKLDAEDWRNLVNAYLDEASKAVSALGGHALKRLGDGLMALFGYPRRRTTPSAQCGLRSRSSALSRRSTPRTAAKAPRICLRGSASKAGPLSWRRQGRCSATRRMSRAVRTARRRETRLGSLGPRLKPSAAILAEHSHGRHWETARRLTRIFPGLIRVLGKRRFGPAQVDRQRDL
jgi:class 3 adenylate cyclase